MDNILSSYQYTIDILEKLSIKHSSHNFASGAIMLDIWHNDNFYVLQFQDDFIGLSKIDEINVGFDTIPDEKFYDKEKFMVKLELILCR